jgi:hypothetical protein
VIVILGLLDVSLDSNWDLLACGKGHSLRVRQMSAVLLGPQMHRRWPMAQQEQGPDPPQNPPSSRLLRPDSDPSESTKSRFTS